MDLEWESSAQSSDVPVSVGIIADDPSRIDVLVAVIEELGWRAVILTSEPSSNSSNSSISLLLLSMDGVTNDRLELISRAGLWSRGSVLVICDNRNPQVIADVLRSGADDYLVSPFEPAELVARMRSLVTRVWPGTDRRTADTIRFDSTKRSIVTGPYAVQFTPLEWDVLNVLLENDGSPLLPEAIVEGIQASQVRCSTIPTIISRIRRKLAASDFLAVSVTTVQNRGYVAQFRRLSDQQRVRTARGGKIMGRGRPQSQPLADDTERLGSPH